MDVGSLKAVSKPTDLMIHRILSLERTKESIRTLVTVPPFHLDWGSILLSKVLARSVGLLIALLITAIFLSSGMVGTAAAFEVHDPISIDGNGALASAGFPGNGTVDNPYLIQGYEINGNGSYAIYIHNTNAYLTIRDCHLYGATGGGKAGIYLGACENVKLINNTCNGNAVGIIISSCNGNLIMNNVCNDNINGIYLTRSSVNTISGNNCNGNLNEGIYLEQSWGNTISSNVCSDNVYRGIYIWYSDGTVITNNDCINNTEGGIYVLLSNNNQLTNNTCTFSNHSTFTYSGGIFLRQSIGSAVTSNDCNNNINGILLRSSTNIMVSSNYCDDNLVSGINLIQSSSNNDIANNTCTGNGENGIRLDTSSNNVLDNNVCNDTPYHGICLASSSNFNTISNNTCGNNSNGIHLAFSSNNNVIEYNDLNDNTAYGIYLIEHCESNRLKNNTCSENEIGIYLYVSSSNVISNNACDDCSSNGIFLYQSDSNTISNNTDTGNGDSGIRLDSSSNNTLVSNTCTGGSYGIFLSSSSNNTLVNNNCTGNGIDLEGLCDFNTISNNTCSNIRISSGCNNTVSNNTCSDSGGRGISLSNGSNDNNVSNNTCSNNFFGIFLIGDRNIISDNDCYDNTNGISVLDGSGNAISNNKCHDNTEAGINLTSSNNVVANNDCNNNKYGIFVQNGGDNTIANNGCSNNIYGIYLYESSNNTVSSNTCVDNQVSIYLCGSSNTVSNNNCDNSGSYGICLDQSSNNTISNNDCNGNYYGFYLYKSSNNTIINNDCTENSDCGINLYRSSNNTISNNDCSDDGRFGIYLFMQSNYNTIFNNDCNNDHVGIFPDGSSNNIISNNTCSENSYGIVLEGSSNNIISNNTCNACTDYGIYLYGSSNFNHIFYNVLTNNNGASSMYNSSQVQAYDECTNYWNSSSYGNHWSDWTAPDADGDGIVDTPYAIDGGSNSDLFPVASLLTLEMTCPVSSPFYTNAASITISGTAYGGFGGNVITWSNERTGGSGICDGTYSWTATFDLALGVNDIILTATDSTGRCSIMNVTVVYDTTAPALDIVSPADGAYNNTGNVTVQWAASDNVGIAYYNVSIDNAAWTTVSGTSYEFIGLDDGDHTVLVQAYDLAGNFNETTVAFVVDTTAPTLTITSPANGSYNNTGNVTVQWAASDNVGIAYYNVSIDNAAWTTVSGTSQVFNGLENGNHTVMVQAYDLAGNSNETTVSFMVDTVAPTITFTPTGSALALNVTMSVTFSETMNITSVLITVNGIPGTLSWSGEVATITPSAALTFNTTYTVVVSGKDLAGNSIDQEWSFSTLKDEGTVAGTIRDQNGNALANVTVTLSGGRTTMTDANGHFLFENVAAGDLTVMVELDGYETLTRNITVTAGVTNDLGELTMIEIPDGDGGDDNSMMIIVVVLMVLVIVGVVGVVLYKKKK